MAVNWVILNEHLRVLSDRHAVSVSDDTAWLMVHEFDLPPGYNRDRTPVLIQIPADYPLSPPGVGSRAYMAPDLRFRDRVLSSYYEEEIPGWGRWGWMCYREILWNPCVDSLVSFMDMVRTDLTNPSTVEPEE